MTILMTARDTPKSDPPLALPTCLPPSPPPPYRAVEKMFAKAVKAYARRRFGYPTQDTPQDTPLPVELAVEQIGGLHHSRVDQWAVGADPVAKARERQVSEHDLPACQAEAARLKVTREARHQELEAHESREAANSRRFERFLPVGAIILLGGIVAIEVPILGPILGRFYDLGGRRQVLATVGTLALVEFLYGATGWAIRAWLDDAGPRAQRRLWRVMALCGLGFDVAIAIGLAKVRSDLATGGQGGAALALFVGMQAALMIASVMIGYFLHDPVAAKGRSLRKELDRLDLKLQAVTNDERLLTEELEVLNEFIWFAAGSARGAGSEASRTRPGSSTA